MLRPVMLLGTLSFAVGSASCQEKTSRAAEPSRRAPFVAPRTVGPIASAVPEAPKPSVQVEPASEHGWVYAKTRFVWIYPDTSTKFQWIGYLWTGGAVRLRSARRIYAKGCEPGWSAIEPRGFVCADGIRATLDPHDPAYVAVKQLAGNLDSPWPHAYGETTGGKAYPGFPLGEMNDPLRLPFLSSSIHDPYEVLPRRSAVAFVREFHAANRDWLLTADLRWLPKSDVTPYPKSEFEGVQLGGKAQLPIAFFRTQARPKYRRKPTGGFEPTGDAWPRLGHVALTAERVTEGDAVYIKVAGESVFVRETDAVIPENRKLTPWGAPVGEPDTTGLAPKGRATWIEASIRGGWLIAYEGTKPVFTTLMSAGRGGPPVGNKPLLKTASTPLGSFPVSGKFATATLANDVVIHSAVPWTQNFAGPYALHTAYWHDEFGDLKSGGCLNLSPKDARYLFGFTEPPLPEGWHGVRWVPKQGPATVVYVIK
ncbi:MAG: L,D-transpeptidase [Polyangiaceae bacterium]|nr:L,D-transpeptidase [Polyangiaceae bacterium]